MMNRRHILGYSILVIEILALVGILIYVVWG